ncbi:hypothetical protein POVWA1_036060 [Plasmodium ovale wallikeri]|uniref:Ran-binding protein, putative n=2 Tax=Plasmodium ovale TaxID=36330 RepID=A0A1C3KTX0_PLAOA|nr:hypothetical protein POVWA1_036060 [Plasmodium ovale wallikeri]SBT77613.1 Ran-binding protein, putative [Plasmodium ovale]
MTSRNRNNKDDYGEEYNYNRENGKFQNLYRGDGHEREGEHRDAPGEREERGGNCTYYEKGQNMTEENFNKKDYDKYERRCDGRYERRSGERYERRSGERYERRSGERYERRSGERYERRYDERYERRHEERYERRYDEKYDRRYHEKYGRRHDDSEEEYYEDRRGKRKYEERRNIRISLERGYSSKNDSEYYDKCSGSKNGEFLFEREKKKFRVSSSNMGGRNEGRQYGNKWNYRNREDDRKRSYNNAKDSESEYSSRSDGDKYYAHSGKKHRFNDYYYEENKEFVSNDYTNNAKKITNVNDILEKKSNIELSRFIFMYKIPEDITEEEIDDTVRNIAINNAFSLPVNIYINKLSYFSTKDELFVRESLEFLKNNSYFNSIQQNILITQVENKINDDQCCIIEFPSNEASGKLFSLFQQKNCCIQIKNNISYVFPIFKLKKKGKIVEEKQPLKKFYDWYCASCNFLNFSRRTACHFCKAVKTNDAKMVESDTKGVGTPFLKNNLNAQDNTSYLKGATNEEQMPFGKFPIDTFTNNHVGVGCNVNTVGGHYNDGMKENSGNSGNPSGKKIVINANSEVGANDNFNDNFNDNLYAYNSFQHNSENKVESFETTVKEVLIDNEKTNMLILKDIDSSTPNKDMVNFLNEIFEKRNVEYLYLFNDIRGSNKRKGFCFVEFNNVNSAKKMMKELEGNYYINFQNNYLKLDYVYEKGKQCFFNCVNLAKLNINKSSAIISKHQIPYFNFFVNYVEAIANIHLLNYTYFLCWTSQIIILKSEKPELTEFFFDYNSQYYYHPVYQIYFDNNTQFYMSLSKGYYMWNEKANCLVRVYMDNEQVNENNEKNQSVQVTCTMVQNGEQAKGKLANGSEANCMNSQDGVGGSNVGGHNGSSQNMSGQNVSNQNEGNQNVGENSVHTKVLSLVEKARMIALASKKNMEQMNMNESGNANLEKKKKEIIKKHFSTDSADEDNDFSDKEELQKRGHDLMNNPSSQSNKELIQISKNNRNSDNLNQNSFKSDAADSNMKECNNSPSKNFHDRGNNNPIVNDIHGIHNVNDARDVHNVDGKGDTTNQQMNNGSDLNICFVCLRKFMNAELLQRHVHMSALHKKNIQATADIVSAV